MKQILAILGMNLRTILARSGSSIVIIIGIAGSVAVMVSLLAMAEGPVSYTHLTLPTIYSV